MIFPLPVLTSLGFSPAASARVRAQWERVAKAEQKQLVLSPDVLTAVCEMSLCAQPPAQEGCLPCVHEAGYRKLYKEGSPLILEICGAVVNLEVLSATLCSGGEPLLAV